MGRFALICEDVRSEIDDQGASGCFRDAVKRFHELTGINTDGLWACVEAYLRGEDATIYLKRIIKAYGGEPRQWTKWLAIISKEPGCPRRSNRV